MRTVKIEDKTFGVLCTFLYGTLAEAIKYMDKRENISHKEVLGASIGCYMWYKDLDSGEMTRYVWVDSRLRGKGEYYNCLVHEIVHLVDSVFRSRNILTTYDNTEVRAMYTSFWVQEFIERMDKLEKKSRKRNKK